MNPVPMSTRLRLTPLAAALSASLLLTPAAHAADPTIAKLQAEVAQLKQIIAGLKGTPAGAAAAPTTAAAPAEAVAAASGGAGNPGRSDRACA